MTRADGPIASAAERTGQSHRRNMPLFILIGGMNVLLSLFAFALLTSFPWSPMRGQEMVAYIIVTVVISVLAALLWDLVVWRTNSRRVTVALSMVVLWALAAVTGLLVEVLVAETGWNSFVVAALLTVPATALNYVSQAGLRRQARRRSGRAA